MSKPYDVQFGDDKVCSCGHSYYRHFDSHDNMNPCGCKYCSCEDFQEGVNLQHIVISLVDEFRSHGLKVVAQHQAIGFCDGPFKSGGSYSYFAWIKLASEEVHLELHNHRVHFALGDPQLFAKLEKEFRIGYRDLLTWHLGQERDNLREKQRLVTQFEAELKSLSV